MFYQNFVYLCEKNGLARSNVCRKLGMSDLPKKPLIFSPIACSNCLRFRKPLKILYFCAIFTGFESPLGHQNEKNPVAIETTGFSLFFNAFLDFLRFIILWNFPLFCDRKQLIKG